MNVKLTIKAIEALTLTFEGQSEVDRLKTYSTIQTLLGEMKNHIKSKEESGNHIKHADMYIVEMESPLRCIAGLDNLGHQESVNRTWILTGLQKLSSKTCFNVG